MIEIEAAIFTVAVISVLHIIRMLLVVKHRSRRRDEVHKRNFTSIEQGDYRIDHATDYHRMGSFDLQILDLTKWTYRQFYPEGLSK